MKEILLPLLIILAGITSASNRTEPCPAEGEFRCRSSGRCIPVLWLCDGARDCAEGEDESEWRCHRHNHTRCAGDQPECGMPDGTFRCILHQWLCDGHEDCEDGSDERGCETKPPDLPSSGTLLHSITSPKCSPSEFRCAGGSCISRDLVCDDVPHCPDASDESEDRCAMPPRVGVPEPAHEEVDDGNWTGNAYRDGLSMPSNPFDLPESRNITNVTRDGVSEFGSTATKEDMINQDIIKDPFTGQINNVSGTIGAEQRMNDSTNILTGADSSANKNSAANSQPTIFDNSPMQSLPADSAFQPQIDNLDFGFLSQAGTSTSTSSQIPFGGESKGAIEDRNQAPPPDPFPFDLANYEIPEAEGDPKEGHDEIGGTGIGVVPTRPQGGLGTSLEGGTIVAPGSSTRLGTTGDSSQKHSGSSDKAIEQLQLANVLQFMSNETKKILKSINATKGHAVHSYKTVRNKSEVHSLSSYKHLPGLYAKLLPFETSGKNETSEITEKPRKRIRRQPVRIRAIQYIGHSNELSKRATDEIERTNNETKEDRTEKEVTLPPIVPLQLEALEGQAVPPIVPSNVDEIEAKKKVLEPAPEEPGSEPETKKESNEPEGGAKPGAAQPKAEEENKVPNVPSKSNTAPHTPNTQSTPKPEVGANEDPKSKSSDGGKPLPARNSISDKSAKNPQAMVARSERLFNEEGKERIVKDERKELPRRVMGDEYRDDGDGAME